MIQLNKYSPHPSLRDKTLYCPDGSQEILEKYLTKVQKHIEAVQIAGNDLIDMFLPLEYSYTLFRVNLENHDLSKFSVDEVYGYANYSFGEDENTPEQKQNFRLSWMHHKRQNSHHPEFWLDTNQKGKVTAMPMPDIYIAEMLADWCGASKIYGTPMKKWLDENFESILFHSQTREKVESCLPKLIEYSASQGH